jgi:hypothetical protein
MTAFLELTVDQYSKTAFDAFAAAADDFVISNARAMMWMSQLAYEAEKTSTIEAVGPLWGFSDVAPFIKRKDSLAASFDTSGLLGQREGAVVLAFAGTDPGIWETLATDFNIGREPDTDTHIGFQTALNAVQGELDNAIEISRRMDKPLYLTGHSLGAALAALAAVYAHAAGTRPKAVYGFGMPRLGGERFQADYDNIKGLGRITYRLVYGLDVVARIPMSTLGYRHIGRVLECESGQKFDAAKGWSPVASDVPDFSTEIAFTLVSGIIGLASGHAVSPTGPGVVGQLLKYLPQPIRDHVPDSYYNALS